MLKNPAARRAVVLAALALALPWAQAQNWPEKTIKLLAPSTAGGPPDVYARALADHLSKALGQAVIVENVPAVGGMLAAQQIQRAPADGYTLLVNTAGMMTITPNANPKARYQGSDFTQVCQGVEAALVLAANPQLGPKNFTQLTQWIKAQKTPPSYSSYSPGSPAHFLGYQLAEALKVDMTHVPYKSSPQQITDMIGGAAPLGFVQIATAAPNIKAGKLVAYATTSEKRSPQLPDVPTVAEVGMPQLTTTVWFGLSGPKGLPPAIVQKLTQAHNQFVASPDVQSRMAIAGLTVTPGICGEPFLKKMEAETVRWGRIVKATGFVAD
ncbi:tripartite tricarboxylate transporter substrate binding protein [Ramlibacter sp. G-1-2-2]|uniref:Tripartite tricarboxylate transporter substrate binding protein n=1 Tax=Ramlibacter agri TaxID=2728837 RepID=A0A848HA98_9BURK|nr:tripartite tricarboxylate transporter substrate binding protein [Ramlibacter agri]NML47404.1 tripartite tricarboxylate transporter substrate binding protein [Ramlibacter agri]